jgi:hypothetical protein
LYDSGTPRSRGIIHHPFDDASVSVLIPDDVSKRKTGLDHHSISIEVMFQLSGCNQDDID